jgi:hypothetical protein
MVEAEVNNSLHLTWLPSRFLRGTLTHRSLRNRAGPSTQMRIGFARLLDPVMRKNGSHLSARRQASELCVNFPSGEFTYF